MINESIMFFIIYHLRPQKEYIYWGKSGRTFKNGRKGYLRFRGENGFNLSKETLHTLTS